MEGKPMIGNKEHLRLCHHLCHHHQHLLIYSNKLTLYQTLKDPNLLIKGNKEKIHFIYVL